MIIAGVFVSLFIPRDALSFPIVQMVIAVFIFTAIVLLLAFWSDITKFFKRNKK
jgi:hypothetical protein